MTREELDRVLRNEQGKPFVRLGWWAETEAALDDEAVSVVAVHLPRQSGKSSFLAREALGTMLREPGSYVLYLASSEAQSQSIFNRKIRRPAERMLAELGVSKRDVVVTKKSLELKELGSAVEVVPTSEATTPGRSTRLLILDEAKDIPDAIFSTLAPSIIASGGRILAASSAGRRRGFFYSLITDPGEGTKVITAAENDNPYADQRKISMLGRLLMKISPAFAQREIANQFADDDVQALLPPMLVARAVDDALGELPTHPGAAYSFLDLSRRKDLTSLVTVVREGPRTAEAKDHLVVASVRTWDPKTSPGHEVDFASVREACAQLPVRFPALAQLLVDEGSEAGSILPWARSHPALTLKADGFQATVERNMQLWGALASRFHSGSLSLPRHGRLLDELASLTVEEFALGGKWRVVDASKKLHRDVSLALAGACFAAGEAGAPALGFTEASLAAHQAAHAKGDPLAMVDDPRGFFGRTMPQNQRRKPDEDEAHVERAVSLLHGRPGHGRLRMFR